MKIKLNLRLLHEDLGASKEPLNEIIGRLIRLHKYLDDAGRLAKVADFAQVIERSKKIITNLKLPRALTAEGLDGKAIFRMIFDDSPQLENQINEVIASIVDRLRRGEAIPLGDGRTSTGAARISFDGVIDMPAGLTSPSGAPIPAGPRAIKIYMTIDADGVVEGSVGIGATGRRRSLKSWRESGGAASGTRSATRRGAEADNTTPSGSPGSAGSGDPEIDRFLDDNQILDPAARKFWTERYRDLKVTLRLDPDKPIDPNVTLPDDWAPRVRALQLITRKINKGEAVVIDTAEAIEDIYNENWAKLVQRAEDAKLIDIDGANETYIPLTKGGRVVLNSEGETIFIVGSPGKSRRSETRSWEMRSGRQGAGFGDDALAAMRELDFAAKMVRQIRLANNVLYEALDKLRAEWESATTWGQKIAAFRKHWTPMWQRTEEILREEFYQWYHPFKAEGAELTNLNKATVYLDIAAGLGITKGIGALVTTALRLVKGSSRGVGAFPTKSLAQTLTGYQILYMTTLLVSFLVFQGAEELDEEKRYYDTAMNPPKGTDPRLALLAYLYSLEENFERNGWSKPAFNVDMTIDQLKVAAMRTHKAYLANVEREGLSFNKFLGQLPGIPLVPDSVYDIVENYGDKVGDIASLEEPARSEMRKQADEGLGMFGTLEKYNDSAMDAVKRVFVDKDKGRRQAEKAIGKSSGRTTPKAPKQDVPSDPGAQDSPLGDLSGIDSSLFEIFSVDKPISIKVKSSSPRLRAKITEKK